MASCSDIESLIARTVRECVTPPPNIAVADWADNYRVLARGTAAEPGQWRTDRAPYQRGIMEACREPATTEIVLMCASQVGKTEMILNLIGYHIHLDPDPVLVVLPTLDLAEKWSKSRFAPMVSECKALSNLIADPRARDSSNTILMKTFPGGYIIMAGANSPASLSSHPIRLVLFDEVDRMGPTVEGCPLELATKRASTYFNKKIVYISSPTMDETSKINELYKDSDMRVWEMPCPTCGEYQELNFEQLKWPGKKPWDAVYHCLHCNAPIKEGKKAHMLKNGRWLRTSEDGKPGRAGFQISSFASPWVRWGELADELDKARQDEVRGDREKMMVYYNTRLGLPWAFQEVNDLEITLYRNCEHYKAEVPKGVILLVAGVDVQADRLEMEVLGIGMNDETWSIDYRVIWGDVTKRDVWDALTQIRRKTFTHEKGHQIPIAAVAIDSGYNTDYVYGYVARHNKERVYAIKGEAGPGKALVMSVSRGRRGQTRRICDLWTLGVDDGKNTLYRRLQITEPGPGYCHFPIREAYGKEYFRQLTADKRTIATRHGRQVPVWSTPSGVRNEAHDCRIYAMAAARILNPDLVAIVQNQKNESDSDKSKPSAQTTRRAGRSSGSFVNSWR